VKLTKSQNHHHHRGVFDMWTKWPRPHAEWAQGPPERPNSLAGKSGFEAVRPEPWLSHVYKRRRRLSWRRESVGATPPSHLATCFGHPTTTWRQTDLSKSVEVQFTPINTPLMVKVNTPHSFCSSPLINFPV
jgi:hypothetical protein